jgi:predicted amidohydrolase YtcJ
MRTVFKNAKIFTGGQDATAYGKHTCMIINDDLIEHVGNDNDAEVEAAIKDSAEVLDLANKTLAPGFIDGHMHLLLFGSSLRKISIEQCKNLSDIQATIRQAAKDLPDQPRLLCKDWMHYMTDGNALASDLEGLDPQNRPIFIDAKDLHSTWCNQAALDEMGVQDLPDPPGGEIKRDESGKASGLMSEAAGIMMVWPHLAQQASMGEKLDAIRDAIQVYNAAGYTGMIEMAMDENGWEALLALREREPLNIRFAIYWLISPKGSDEEHYAQVDRAAELHKKYNLQTSPNLRIAGIKIIGDGVVDACTAGLLEPYSSNGVTVDPLWSLDDLKKVTKRADNAGLQCALHAIGDATIKISIDALEAIKTSGRRARIEHLELTRPDTAKRLNEAGITASIQPVHVDPAILGAWDKLVGKDRFAQAFAHRQFLDAEVPLAIGTDSPTADHFPLANLYTATTRRSAREPERVDTVNKEFALPLLNAFAAATQGAAYSVFAEKMVGTLQAGMKADFVVLDMEWKPEKLLEARVLQTHFDGRCVFRAS